MSLATLIRESVDGMLRGDDTNARWEAALKAAGRLRSGRQDVSVEHDKYLAEDLAL